MIQITSYGKQIKKRLVDLDRSQAWLIQEVIKRTGLFMDSGYLYKIMTGQRNAPSIVAAINEILNLTAEKDAS